MPAPSLIVALAIFAQAAPPPDPTKPSLVALDFKNRPAQEIAAAIAARSGNSVLYQGTEFGMGEPNVRKHTLTAPAPVPFWEAIDRLCADSKLQVTVNDLGGLGSGGQALALVGPFSEPVPASYSGPFRLSKFMLHATYRKRFVTRVGFVDPAADDGYRAEFEVQPEPRVLAIRTGPLAKLEAIDDQGKSLLDPALSDPEKVSAPVATSGFGGFQSLVRVRLGTPSAGSKRLKTLRGVMPVEVAIPPTQPTATIPLAASVGKTTKVGDMAITIEEFATPSGSPATVRLVAKLEGARGPDAPGGKPLAWARTAAIQRCLDVVDSNGRVLTATSSGSSGGDALSLSYTFWTNQTPGQPGAPPKSLRVFVPRWVAWDAPFEFSDLPLP